jgi:hypothetical protein
VLCVLVNVGISERFTQLLLHCHHSNQVLACNYVATVCGVYTLILHCLLCILFVATCSLHQEENIKPNKTAATSTTTTATAATTAATGADTTLVKRASSGDAVSAVQKPTKLQPVKLRYLNLDDV